MSTMSVLDFAVFKDAQCPLSLAEANDGAGMRIMIDVGVCHQGHAVCVCLNIAGGDAI